MSLEALEEETSSYEGGAKQHSLEDITSMEDETLQENVDETSKQEDATEEDPASTITAAEGTVKETAEKETERHVEPKETEETHKRSGAELPSQESDDEPEDLTKHFGVFDDPRRTAGVTVVRVNKGEEPDVLEESRSQYLWEGLCESSTSSEEEKQISSQISRYFTTGEKKAKEKEFTREECIQIYKTLTAERCKLKKKNLILQKHLFDYCRKRKLEVYFEEIQTPDPKMEIKYLKQLKTFDEFLKADEKRRQSLSEEFRKLDIEKYETEAAFERSIEELTETEREVGSQLVFSSIGKSFTEKTLEKMLVKQRKTILHLHDVRLKYIRLRDSLAGKEATLKKIETVGEGLHLFDYEQLRMENQSYSDKIEERDEELTRLRVNATQFIQTLAHIREKASATATNIEDLYDDLEYIEADTNQMRENAADLKRNRAALRVEFANLREEAGLLVHKHLIKDFERRIEESQAFAVEIQNLKNNYFDRNKKLLRVKESIQEIKDSISLQMPIDYHGHFPRKSTEVGKGKTVPDQIKKVHNAIKPSFSPQLRYSRLVQYVPKSYEVERRSRDNME